jgi:sialidase-1
MNPRHLTALALCRHLVLSLLLIAASRAAELPFATPADLLAWKTPDGKWAVKEGALTQSDEQQRGTIAWLAKPAYGDLDLSVEFFVQPKGSGVRAAGVVFHAADQDNYAYLHFDTRNHNILWVRLNPAGKGKDVRRHPHPPLTANRWHTARLVVKGMTQTLHLDGKPLFTESDDALPTGHVGLRTGQGRVTFRKLSVTGTPVQPEREFVIRPPLFGTVCRDAGAGAYEAFPDLCRTKTGELLCVFYAGYGHVSVPNERLPKGARIALCRSRDDGKTWSPAETVVDTPIDDRDASIIALPSGDLLVTFMTYDPKRKSGTHQVYSVRSANNGRTWSQPIPLPTPFTQLEAITSPPRLMPDGTLLLTPYGNHTGDPRRYKYAAVLASRDEGRTWTTRAELKSPDHVLLEPDLVHLPDKRLLLMMRPTMTWSESTDNGHTWAAPKPVGIPGDCPYLLLTSRNLLLCGIRHRPTHSTCVLTSTDFGRTWSKPITIDSVLGAYPSMVELPDGRILVVYYTEGSGSDIRRAYLKQTGDTVKVVRGE